MEKRLLNYISYIENAVNNPKDVTKLREELLVQIGFFAHERLVHLIVTVIFAVLTMMSVVAFLVTEKVVVIALVLMLMVLLVPYIRHYFILENGVQKLYKLYDKLGADPDWVAYVSQFDVKSTRGAKNVVTTKNTKDGNE